MDDHVEFARMDDGESCGCSACLQKEAERVEQRRLEHEARIAAMPSSLRAANATKMYPTCAIEE